MGIVEGVVILLVFAVGYFVFTDKSKRSKPLNEYKNLENKTKDISRIRQMAEWDRFSNRDK